MTYSEKKVYDFAKKPAARCCHTAVTCGSKMFVYGGLSQLLLSKQVLGDIWVFDLDTHLWQDVNPKNAVMPVERHSHTAVSIHNRFMVIYGGSSSTGKNKGFRNDCWMFDTQLNLWQEIVLDGYNAPERMNHAMCSLGMQFLLVHGGSGKVCFLCFL